MCLHSQATGLANEIGTQNFLQPQNLGPIIIGIQICDDLNCPTLVGGRSFASSPVGLTETIVSKFDLVANSTKLCYCKTFNRQSVPKCL